MYLPRPQNQSSLVLGSKKEIFVKILNKIVYNPIFLITFVNFYAKKGNLTIIFLVKKRPIFAQKSNLQLFGNTSTKCKSTTSQ